MANNSGGEQAAIAHARNFQRCVLEWDDVSTAEISSLVQLTDALLRLTHDSASSTRELSFCELLQLRADRRAKVQQVHEEVSKALSRLRTTYVRISAAAESIQCAMDVYATAAAAEPGPACSADGGGVGSIPPSLAPWRARCAERTRELCGAILCHLAADLSAKTAIVQRLCVQGYHGVRGHDSERSLLVGPPRHFGLPLQSETDREHLTTLVSMWAVGPYVPLQSTLAELTEALVLVVGAAAAAVV